MEEFNIQENFKDIVDTYYYFKRNSKLLYRVSLEIYNKYNKSYLREFLTNQSRWLMYKFI